MILYSTHVAIELPSLAKDFATGIELLPGRAYNITGSGTWTDWYIPASPAGYLSSIASNLARMPNVRLFTLICCVGPCGNSTPPSGLTAVAQAGNCIQEASWLSPATCLNGSASLLLEVPTPVASRTQAHCFANDIDFMYWNNYGSINLTVSLIENSTHRAVRAPQRNGM